MREESRSSEARNEFVPFDRARRALGGPFTRRGSGVMHTEVSLRLSGGGGSFTTLIERARKTNGSPIIDPCSGGDAESHDNSRRGNLDTINSPPSCGERKKSLEIDLVERNALLLWAANETVE